MPVVWSDACRLHEPGGEIFVGVRTPGTEVPQRVDAIRRALADATFVEAETHAAEALLHVHEAPLLEFLAHAWGQWTDARLSEEPGAGLVSGGARAAYACVRPPGHHAGVCSFGGSCYLNNSAVAAAALAERFGDVAVLDVDAHHGNGTQEIFRGRDDVLVGSVHVDPGAGWFPHFVGFTSENDETNRNVPLAPGSGDEPWLAAVRELADWARGARALVVPLGVDAAAVDPESPLRVSPAAFREAGGILGGLGLPAVFVQEGGYDLATIGELVRETLLGFEEAR
jgi:acetoin utilization deacetylase AcuC-like enzyme